MLKKLTKQINTEKAQPSLKPCLPSVPILPLSLLLWPIACLLEGIIFTCHFHIPTPIHSWTRCSPGTGFWGFLMWHLGSSFWWELSPLFKSKALHPEKSWHLASETVPRIPEDIYIYVLYIYTHTHIYVYIYMCGVCVYIYIYILPHQKKA